MALLEIYQYPERVLLKKALPVETIDETVIKLVNDMGETMFAAPGVGLAAPQVGQSRRIIVYNPQAGTPEDKEDSKEFKALINPEIIASSGSIVSENEACLSVPDYSCNVKRFETVTVRALNLDGKKLEFDAQGLLAVIMQHEIDHLDGILYIERISTLKRNMYKKKIKKRLAEQ
jgi:peptide deformylase